jgi:hypothetical protein
LLLFCEIEAVAFTLFADKLGAVLPIGEVLGRGMDDLPETLDYLFMEFRVKRVGDFGSLPFVVLIGTLRGILKPAARGSEDSCFDLFDLLRAEKLQEMGSLLAVTDPEGIIKTSAHDVGVKLATVTVVHLSLKSVTETVIRHAFQLGDSPAIGFQSRNAIGVAENLYPIDLDVKLFFLRAPRFRAMFSEFLLEPFIDSFPFFEDHEDPRRHGL